MFIKTETKNEQFYKNAIAFGYMFSLIKFIQKEFFLIINFIYFYTFFSSIEIKQEKYEISNYENHFRLLSYHVFNTYITLLERNTKKFTTLSK